MYTVKATLDTINTIKNAHASATNTRRCERTANKVLEEIVKSAEHEDTLMMALRYHNEVTVPWLISELEREVPRMSYKVNTVSP
jgi:hypothetical protein